MDNFYENALDYQWSSGSGTWDEMVPHHELTPLERR